jgi:hypothetical protein
MGWSWQFSAVYILFLFFGQLNRMYITNDVEIGYMSYTEDNGFMMTEGWPTSLPFYWTSAFQPFRFPEPPAEQAFPRFPGSVHHISKFPGGAYAVGETQGSGNLRIWTELVCLGRLFWKW